VVVARIAGELDCYTAPTLREVLDRELDASGAASLVLNLRDASFIDSSGLGAILGRYRRLAPGGGRVAVCEAQPSVRRVLELAGIPRIIPLYPSEEQALEAQKAVGT